MLGVIRRFGLRLFAGLAGPTARRFRAALDDPQAAQAALAGRLGELGEPRGWDEQDLSDIGRVVMSETTSGSSGPKKVVPYNRALLAAFTRSFVLQAHDLVTHVPFTTGRTWMLVTPPAAGTVTDDRDYLSGWVKWLAWPYLLAPSGNAANWQEKVVLALLRARDLEVMSAWSPTLVHVLLDVIESLGIEPRRAWPRLKVVSVWADGQAEAEAARLGERLGVWVQGKGLLATECPMTVPLVGVEGSVPLVEDTLLELLGDDGVLRGLHEVSQGEHELVVSTLGGLRRYRIGDRVRVVGRVSNTPTLKLVGRAGTSDLAGEKLSEPWVAEVLARFALTGVLAPRADGKGYELWTELATEGLPMALDAALCEAHHYGLARALGQLEQVRVREVEDLQAALMRVARQEGRRLGDVKVEVLRRRRWPQ